jgi:hypothetical protein
LLNVLDAVGKAGAGFRSLADEWCDTTTARAEKGEALTVIYSYNVSHSTISRL